MSAKYTVDVEVALQGARIDVGETLWCDDCLGELHEGAPVTIVARTRSDGWDVERVWCARHGPTELDAEPRDGEGIALAEGTAILALDDQQVWVTFVRPDVLEWIEPA